MAGIYIHIPFCRQACHYCDFHFSTNQTLVPEISQAISWELEYQKEYLQNEEINTIYFGGGTPSVLPPEQIFNILQTIKKNFSVAMLAEITMEANPEDLSLPKLQTLKSNGINRLSIGVQSFDDGILKFLNRSHDKKQITDSIQNARQVGFSNINVDLIYAIPGRNNTGLRADLDSLIQLNPEHISAYSLTIEEKTVFGNWARKAKFIPVSEEENASQFEMVLDRLMMAGYDHYEISNYSKPGFESRHNSSYWKQQKYLGVGPSAHSFNGVSRQFNVSSNYGYLKSIQEGKIPAQQEILSRENQINEYLMISLRTKWGCDLNYMKEKLDYNLLETQGEPITQSIKNGLMLLENGKLTLTRKGKLLADKLSSDLFLITS
jgi:oxygen-independent coproporphyrinogen-3 oxidase